MFKLRLGLNRETKDGRRDAWKEEKLKFTTTTKVKKGVSGRQEGRLNCKESKFLAGQTSPK